MPLPRRAKAGLGAVLACSVLTGCAIFGSPANPIPTVIVRGTQSAPHALVVVLPGFIYDADDLYDKGVADSIHRGWPAADVLLVGATYPYYRDGLLVPRLHDRVLYARQQGYREIWLAGGSMGGMGVLLYEWAHAGELTGIVLMSPFLGSDALFKEIRVAGGLANWNPGPLAPEMDGDNYQRHVWNMIKGWKQRPALAKRAWLVCGTEDPLFPDVQVLAPEVPPEQYLARLGGHNWDFWLPVLEETFRKIAGSGPGSQ